MTASYPCRFCTALLLSVMENCFVIWTLMSQQQEWAEPVPSFPVSHFSASNTGGIGAMAVPEDEGLVRSSVRWWVQVLSIVVERWTGDGDLMPEKRTIDAGKTAAVWMKIKGTLTLTQSSLAHLADHFRACSGSSLSSIIMSTSH